MDIRALAIISSQKEGEPLSERQSRTLVRALRIN